MEKNQRKDYEEFHKTSAIQTSLIKSNNFTYRIILDVIAPYLTRSKKVLDIGCGAGTLSLYLASNGNNVVGIDISEKAIEICKKSAQFLDLSKYASFQVRSFPNDIPAGKFDLILCSEVIEHIEEDQLALAKISALLKPRGIVIISTPSKNAPLFKVGYARGFDQRVGHLRRYSINELTIKCKKAGLQVIETKKAEGIIRNFFFLNPIAGRFIRLFTYAISDVISFIDTISLKLFGESQIFVIARRQV